MSILCKNIEGSFVKVGKIEVSIDTFFDEPVYGGVAPHFHVGFRLEVLLEGVGCDGHFGSLIISFIKMVYFVLWGGLAILYSSESLFAHFSWRFANFNVTVCFHGLYHVAQL